MCMHHSTHPLALINTLRVYTQGCVHSRFTQGSVGTPFAGLYHFFTAMRALCFAQQVCLHGALKFAIDPMRGLYLLHAYCLRLRIV